MSSTFTYLMSLIKEPKTQAGTLPASSSDTFSYLKSLIKPDADVVWVPEPQPEPPTSLQIGEMSTPYFGSTAYTYQAEKKQQEKSVKNDFQSAYTKQLMKDAIDQRKAAASGLDMNTLYNYYLIDEALKEEIKDPLLIGEMSTPYFGSTAYANQATQPEQAPLTASDYEKLMFAAAGLPTSISPQQQEAMKRDYEKRWFDLNDERMKWQGLDPDKYDYYNQRIKDIEAAQQRLDVYGFNQKQDEQRRALSSVQYALDFQQNVNVALQANSTEALQQNGKLLGTSSAKAQNYIRYIVSPEFKAMADAMMGQTSPDEDTMRLNYLTPDEKNIMLYYAGKGDWDSVQKYFDTIKRTLGERKQAERDAKEQAFATEHPWLATAESILAAPFQVLGYADTVRQSWKNRITGEYEPTDTTTAAYQPAHVVQNIGNGVMIDKDTGEQKTGFRGFFWQVVPGAAQFAATLPFGPEVSLALLSTEAAGQMALTAQQNGATPQQAFALSTIAGAASYLTNKIPVGKLFDMMGNGAKSFTNGLIRYAGQIGENVAQCVLENYANTLADTGIMGDKSQLNNLIRQYEADGLSYDEAARKAMMQLFILNPLDEAWKSGTIAAIISAYPAFHTGSNVDTTGTHYEAGEAPFNALESTKQSGQSLNDRIVYDWNNKQSSASSGDMLKWPETVNDLDALAKNGLEGYTEGAGDAAAKASNKTIVIGETMVRVKKYAAEIGAETYKEFKYYDKTKAMFGEKLANFIGGVDNALWLIGKMVQKYKIVDLGLDMKRLERSPYYLMESVLAYLYKYKDYAEDFMKGAF